MKSSRYDESQFIDLKTDRILIFNRPANLVKLSLLDVSFWNSKNDCANILSPVPGNHKLELKITVRFIDQIVKCTLSISTKL